MKSLKLSENALLSFVQFTLQTEIMTLSPSMKTLLHIEYEKPDFCVVLYPSKQENLLFCWKLTSSQPLAKQSVLK